MDAIEMREIQKLVGTVFCEIDDELISILKPLIKSRTILDVGAGMGMLGSKLPGVVGIDLYPPEKQLSPVRRMPVEMWPFASMPVFPMFIRPCHSGFPGETLAKNKEHIADAIYISHPENMVDDLHDYIDSVGGINNVKYEEFEWEGKDGEHVFHIIVNDKLYDEIKNKKMTKFFRVTFEHYTQYGDNPLRHAGWYQKIDSPYREGKVWKNLNGGMCPVSEGDIVHEEVEVESINDLDWTKTGYGPEHMEKDPYNGWLSPTGKFVQSSYEGHEDTAELIIQESSTKLEEKGWVRLQKGGYIEPDKAFVHKSKDYITRKQYEYMLKHELLKDQFTEEDVRF